MAPDKQITPRNAAQQLNGTTIGKRRKLSHEERARGSEGSRPADAAATRLLGVAKDQAALWPSFPADPGPLTLPEYGGAWHLAGTLRGPYDGGGLVVQKGDRYFVVEGADASTGGSDNIAGYVEDSGRTIFLDIGRSGREASVVRLSDKETYQEDQAAFKQATAEARREHDSAMRSLPGLIATWRLARAELPDKETTIQGRWRKAAEEFEEVLRSGARALASFGAQHALQASAAAPEARLDGFADVQRGAVAHIDSPSGTGATVIEHLDPTTLNGITSLPIRVYAVPCASVVASDPTSPSGLSCAKVAADPGAAYVGAISVHADGDVCDQLNARLHRRYAPLQLEDVAVRAEVTGGEVTVARVDADPIGMTAKSGTEMVDGTAHRWASMSGPVTLIVTGNDADRMLESVGVSGDHYSYPEGSPRHCLLVMEPLDVHSMAITHLEYGK